MSDDHKKMAMIVSYVHAITGTNETKYEEKGMDELNKYLAAGWEVESSVSLGSGSCSSVKKSMDDDFHHEIYTGAGSLLILRK